MDRAAGEVHKPAKKKKKKNLHQYSPIRSEQATSIEYLL